MPKYSQQDPQISDSVNLLISILVRYPEIGTVDFNPGRQSLKLTFMLSSIPSQPEFLHVQKLLLDSAAAYHMLEGLRDTKMDVQLTTFDKAAMLTIHRDVQSLSKGEITLLIAILRDTFKERLVCDQNDSMLEEDLLVQEEVIDNMLENMKTEDLSYGLIGIREDGRVLVFNK